MRLLDLFCGAGGAAMGYYQAGFTEIVGVDISPQPNYPFEFIQGDALEWEDFDGYDLIHASPPCQAYSVLRRANPGAEYADLIEPTRALLQKTGIPWVIENVPGAPLNHSVVLCGSMFDLGALSGDGVKAKRMFRQLRRHRLFESSFFMLQPSCQHRGEAIGVYGGGPTGRYTFENGAKKDRYGRRGGYQGTIAEKQAAMGMTWTTASEINQAIPPAYSRFIGEQFLSQRVALLADDGHSVDSSLGRTFGISVFPGRRTGSHLSMDGPEDNASSEYSHPEEYAASDESSPRSGQHQGGLD